ncbi:hypothetical protein SAMN05216436_10733 [bacterium A37T11]|nr:hypothetical protein SAMN05216436_10733 [bacterium A37T11]
MSAFSMNVKRWSAMALFPLVMVACNDDDDNMQGLGTTATLTVENVLQGKLLVESGTFMGNGSGAPVILPGETVSFTVSAGKGQRLSFAAMYGLSNDLFFAPENPGIALYTDAGEAIEGDVSASVKLWDNGTRVNQKPGAAVVHPGTAENKMIREVTNMDDQGNSYEAASKLLKVTLAYQGNSVFKVTLNNSSKGTINETGISPGVWSVSYIAGGDLLNKTPLYETGKASTEGLTLIAESGDNSKLSEATKANTGIFTPLSPILVAVYEGDANPFFKVGENDRGEGLAKLAQTGNADDLAASLKKKSGVKNVYVLPDPANTVLLPSVGGAAGGKVQQLLTLSKGQHVAIATMYGFSNDWFFAGNVDGSQRGDISGSLHLYDNGTALDEFPGAGISQVNLGGKIVPVSKPISEVPNPNAFTTLPELSSIIKVTLN